MGFNQQAFLQRDHNGQQHRIQLEMRSEMQSRIGRWLRLGMMAVSAIAVTTACGNSPATVSASPPAPPPMGTLPPPPSLIATPPSPTASPTQAEAAKNYLISAEAIGAARLGMTYGQLKQTLGKTVEFKVESPFMTDFDAIAIKKDGEVLYRILYLAKQTFKDTDLIQGILTDNPKFRTAQTVGPGTSIEESEKAYGKATLSYNTENESKEYARFERQPAGNLAFSTGNGNQNAVGVYPSPLGEFNETKEFKQGAKIKSVLLICTSGNCTAATANPSPNASPTVSPNASPTASPQPIPNATPQVSPNPNP